MVAVIPWRQRSSVVALALLASGTGALASLNACSLNSNGLSGPGDAGPDGTVLDAAIDVVEGAADAIADVVRGDGCAPVETNCLDGIDDDCNGLTDCADPACGAGYSCVPAPAASSGFTGFAIYEPTRTNPCPSAYAAQTDTYEGLVYLPAACAACACQAQGASCGAATLTCNAGTCDSDGGSGGALAEGCTAIDGGVTLGAGSACSVSAPAASPGSCNASGGGATLDPVTFGLTSRVCAATAGPGGGCGAGSVCVARAADGFHGACVLAATDSTALCPAGYLNAHVTMPDGGSFTDTRGCTACSCASPTGAACGGSAMLYPSSSCEGDGGGAGLTFPADGNCYPAAAAGVIGSALLSGSVLSQGACAPDGGQVTGAVRAKNQTIYCCQD